MPVFICYHHHLLHNLLDIFIGSFQCAIYLGSVRRRIMMLDFELSEKLRNHSIVEISSIVSDNPFGDAIMADEIMLNEPGYNVLGN